MRNSSFICSLGLVGLALAACASNDKKPSPTYLGLATLDATQGFQLRSKGMDINAGEDTEYCETSQLPGSPSDTYYVNEIEYGNGDHSHHLIINIATQGSAAETELAKHELGYTVKCRSGQVFGEGMEFTGGVQTPYGKQSFPEGVGRVYHGGQRLVFDYHYYNTTDHVVHALSAVQFHLTTAANVKHVARIFGFSNWTIDTPPHQLGSFTGECHFKQDATVLSLARHTHRWGTDYTVWYSSGPNDGKEIFKSPAFEDNLDHFFPAPWVIKAGEGFRFQCNYNNTEDHALTFGLNATDEMCILFGQYWEATDGENLLAQDCSITSIGPDGIGRPTSEGASFRTPTTAEVSACMTNIPYTGECAQCDCSTCAGVMADCFANADCAAIMNCAQTSGCRTQTDCLAACGDVISAHASGVGPSVQVGSCLNTCAPVCGTGGDGGADAGGDGG